jgi:hypothetical protein
LISPLQRAHGFQLRKEIVDHRSIEVQGHVADLEREAGDPGDLGGIGAGGRPAASVLDALQMNQVHV